jgi:hypothetical protein
MTAALAGKEAKRFAVPSTVEYANVCAISGQKPTAFCPVVREVFVKGQTPTMLCPVHRPVQDGGQTKVAYVLPPEAAGWLQAVGAGVSALQWTGVWLQLPPIAKPIVDRTEIIGTVAGDDLIRWELHLGVGKEPKEWTLLARGNGPVLNKPLTVWKPGDLRGAVTLRLSAIDRHGVVRRAQIVAEISPPV